VNFSLVTFSGKKRHLIAMHFSVSLFFVEKYKKYLDFTKLNPVTGKN
jgi:hypothetical protein